MRTATFARNRVTWLVITVMVLASMFAFTASTGPLAGVGSQGVNIAASVDIVTPGSAGALATAETMVGIGGFGLPILLTYGIIDTTARSLGIMRPSAAAAVTTSLATQTTTATTRGDPNTTAGFGFFTNAMHTLTRSFGALPVIATNVMYGAGILVLTIGIGVAAYVFARRLRYVAQATTTKMSTSGALALAGGPQARQIDLMAGQPEKPIIDMRRFTDDTRHRSPAI